MQVEIDALTFSYQNTTRTSPTLKSISVHIPPGSKVALMGAPGSGKSTLILIMAGLLQTQQGQVRYNGRPVSAKPDKRWLRRQIAVALQQPETQFFAGTVWDEVGFALYNSGQSKAVARENVSRALARFGLNPEEYGPRSPFTLSGGEARRVALASVMVTQPSLLLLDEPLAGLDMATAAEVWRAVNHTLDELHATCIVATHDSDTLFTWADHVVIMAGGRVAYHGSPTTIPNAIWHEAGLLEKPLDRLAAQLRQGGWALPPDLTWEPHTLAQAMAQILGQGSC